MKEIVTVNGEEITVSGRMLHDRLGTQTRYNDWFSRVCVQYGLIDGTDFVAITQKRVTAQGNETTYTDHALKVDAVMGILMAQKTPQGKAVRDYFVGLKRKWDSPEMVKNRAIKIMDAENKALVAQNEKLVAEIEILKPKAQFADALSATDDCVAVGDFAKTLTQAGYPIGQNRMYNLLTAERIIFRNGHGDYVPYQRYAEMGIFRIVKTVIHNPKKPFAKTTLKVTPKGQKYLLGRFAPRAVVTTNTESPLLIAAGAV